MGRYVSDSYKIIWYKILQTCHTLNDHLLALKLLSQNFAAYINIIHKYDAHYIWYNAQLDYLLLIINSLARETLKQKKIFWGY